MVHLRVMQRLRPTHETTVTTAIARRLIRPKPPRRGKEPQIPTQTSGLILKPRVSNPLVHGPSGLRIQAITNRHVLGQMPRGVRKIQVGHSRPGLRRVGIDDVRYTAACCTGEDQHGPPLWRSR